MASTARDFGKNTSILDPSTGRAPSISKDTPSASTTIAQIAPWASEDISVSPSSAFAEGACDGGQDNMQYPTALRPGTGRTGMSDSPDALSLQDERRPSLASATTVSSQGSSSKVSESRRKKLAGFFGEEPSRHESQRNSESSIPMAGQRTESSHSYRDRNNSLQANNNDSQAISPAGSRPRTPLPSSDVVPWLFQNFQVSSRGLIRSTQSKQVCLVFESIFLPNLEGPLALEVVKSI